MQIDVICVYTCVVFFFFNFLTNRSQAPLSYFQASWSQVHENTDKSVNTWFILPQASGKYLFDVGKHCENSSKTNGTTNIANNKILMGDQPHHFFPMKRRREIREGKTEYKLDVSSQYISFKNILQMCLNRPVSHDNRTLAQLQERCIDLICTEFTWVMKCRYVLCKIRQEQ